MIIKTDYDFNFEIDEPRYIALRGTVELELNKEEFEVLYKTGYIIENIKFSDVEWSRNGLKYHDYSNLKKKNRLKIEKLINDYIDKKEDNIL